MALQKPPAYQGIQAAGKLSNYLTRALISKKENFLASILYDWPIIIGEKYASHVKPQKVSFPKEKNKGATLHLSVTNGSMAVMVHHLQPFILSKVNQFIGYEAFEKITLQQTKNSTSVIASKFPAPAQKLTTTQVQELEILLNETPEGDLKEALKALGESLYLQKDGSQ